MTTYYAKTDSYIDRDRQFFYQFGVIKKEDKPVIEVLKWSYGHTVYDIKIIEISDLLDFVINNDIPTHFYHNIKEILVAGIKKCNEAKL